VERRLELPGRIGCNASAGPSNYNFVFVNVDARPWRRMRLGFAVAISRQGFTPDMVSVLCESHDILRRSVNVCNHRHVFACVFCAILCHSVSISIETEEHPICCPLICLQRHYRKLPGVCASICFQPDGSSKTVLKIMRKTE
jgi:hypothetical protein